MAGLAFQCLGRVSAPVEIIDFTPEYAAHFERLNREWLEALFRVEPIDAKVLSDPGRHVIEPGGHILMATIGDEVVGTVALMHEGNGHFELAKMAVTADARGKGVGRALGEAAIERFRAVDGQFLHLDSHSSLAPALALYESLGFRPGPRPEPSDYERCDVYMVFDA